MGKQRNGDTGVDIVIHCAEATQAYVQERSPSNVICQRVLFAIATSLMGPMMTSDPEEATAMLNEVLARNGVAWRMVRMQ